MSEGFQTVLSNPGTTEPGSFCIQDIPSVEELLQLEGRPRLPSEGCLQTGLDPILPICLPPLLPHHSSFERTGVTESRQVDFNRTSMAVPDMVPRSLIQSNSSTHFTSKVTLTAEESSRGDSSFASKRHLKPSGLASVGQKLAVSGVPENACKLMLNSRREGTTRHYESSWKQWILWCNTRGVDAFTCPINEVLGYLASLFDKNLQYRTIGSHRSAISAYHEPIDGFAVGSHPQVSRLMSGVSNLRPPQPKYGFTWDVEMVLDLFRSWPDNLSEKQLSMKTITLLSLVAISRGAEIHLLDLNYLTPKKGHYRFRLAGLVKNVKEGDTPDPIDFYEHEADVRLCPIKTIDSYIAMTKPWRNEEGIPSTFFLSFKSPHKPISTSRLAKWLKETLTTAGVNTNIFTSHSIRGAASSKALLSGLTVKQVLDHGSWSNESTWQRFYHRKIESNAKKFQDSVLGL